MASLWFAKSFVKDSPFVYMHGDIIYHEDIFVSCFEHFKINSNDIELVTDFGKTDEESMKVRVTDKNYLLESNKEIPLHIANGEWTGIAFVKSSRILFQYIEKILFENGLNHYDTLAFTQMAKNGLKILCTPTNSLPWIEIDYLNDYKQAKRLFR